MTNYTTKEVGICKKSFKMAKNKRLSTRKLPVKSKLIRNIFRLSMVAFKMLFFTIEFIL